MEKPKHISGAKRSNKNTSPDQVSHKMVSGDSMNVLSFFSGALGMDIGLEQEGFNVLLACEIDDSARKTIIANKPDIGLIGDIRSYSIEEVLRFANVQSANDIDLIVGGPPCQAFSTAGKRLGFEDERGNVFLKFIDSIAAIKPKYAVIENVRGILSSVLSIDPKDGIMDSAVFDPTITPGASLYYIVRKLESIGYTVSFNLYNAANYGVPQIRERVVIICTLDKEPVPYLTPTHSQNGDYNLIPWTTFGEAVANLKGPVTSIKMNPKRLPFIEMLKPGQNWRDLPTEIQPQAMGKSYEMAGGKTGFYRRLAWDKPSPTLVTHPAMPATELAHPVEPRPLSVEEYKRIQQFPDEWQILGPVVEQYKQIGNAVPVGLGRAIAKTILQHSQGLKPNYIPSTFAYSRYRNTSNLDFFSMLHRQSVKTNVPQMELAF